MALYTDYLPEYYSTASTVALLTVIYLLYVILGKVLAYRSSPIRDLPGPKSVDWLTGSHERSVWEPDSQDTQLEWTQKYGPVFRFYGWFNLDRIITTDLQSLNYILNAPEFEKTDDARLFLGDVLGKGLLVVEGLKHRQQRKLISPAFGLPQIKAFSHLFVEKANEFCDVLMAEIARSHVPDGSLGLDMYLWLNKITLDMIGQAGFNYSFGSLYQEEPHEMTEGFRKSTTFNPFSIRFMIPALIPPARLIPTDRSRALASTLKSVRSIGQNLISQKKAEILATSVDHTNGGVEKKDIQGRDLLSLLIKANMATDIPDNVRMSDEEILAQVPTFLIAGHETTSTAIAWALYALGCHPVVRAKLNVEARTFHTDTPSMDELNGMTYLDYVTREVLRLYSPVTQTERVAREDTVVPLSEPFVDKRGIKRHEFRVQKGDVVYIPIRVVHRLKSLWGDDADEFKPERWEVIPDAVRAIPGVFSNLLAFITGAHACIGYRFSIIEMKALLFSFVRSFDFELAVPSSDIIQRTMIVARPFLATDPGKGPQLPLIIRPAKSD
ncbi:cytochrome P450 [Multifurca ochricompacta]|uniref:Cytochrome P450 n=1 Tax=Multifurca ochricompacta TaxID=376703 RepID=A0AAD4M2I9_9AGAM|nr:cytochrome P450 [Multifurca ochricompacta]